MEVMSEFTTWKDQGECIGHENLTHKKPQSSEASCLQHQLEGHRMRIYAQFNRL